MQIAKLLLPIICLIGTTFAAETRVKVGAKRWAFHIETNEGQNVRKEYTDENGVTFGTFTFVSTDDNTPKQLHYKFDLNADEPDISFKVVNESVATNPNVETPAESTGADSTAAESTGDPESASNITSTTPKSTEPNYESIDGEEEFSGHVSLKVGKSSYLINFLSGDKTAAREEALDDSGLIYGKYTYFHQQKQSKVVVNYKFNSSGSDPTFEVSMYKKSEPNRLSPQDSELNPNTYYGPNRVDRRILYDQPYRQRQPSMPSVTVHSTNPPHNIITPMQGNWYYRVQK
ncbi:uncharacterized protein LOC128955341 [Oppia nitens]|uniref:uncharacterized protein LOC128955341 n=1 Tax=Oppia nitens TaxID=1686743 RepID=UPI0023DAAAE7|nr:uncharacterized protein LOC128955341 [Oppia nitens]